MLLLNFVFTFIKKNQLSLASKVFNDWWLLAACWLTKAVQTVKVKQPRKKRWCNTSPSSLVSAAYIVLLAINRVASKLCGSLSPSGRHIALRSRRAAILAEWLLPVNFPRRLATVSVNWTVLSFPPTLPFSPSSLPVSLHTVAPIAWFRTTRNTHTHTQSCCLYHS